MKRTFKNELGELFELERGTLKEIKNYQDRTDIYLYQDEDTKKWYLSFVKSYCDNATGKWSYGVHIPVLLKITKEKLANLLGYYEC